MSIITFRLSGISQDIDSLVCTNMSGCDWNKYFKMRRLEDLYVQSLVAGDDDFDWIKVHKRGWLCENDYKIFDELRDLKPEDWNK